MSFQVTVLKVLAGHPGGCLSVDDLKRAVAILMTSGSDWTDRTKRLASRAPGMSIFSSGYVLRNTSGWQITDAGLVFLSSIEAPVLETALAEPDVAQPITSPAPPPSGNVIPIADDQVRRRRAAA